MGVLYKLLYPFALFHYLVYLLSDKYTKSDIDEDIEYMNYRQQKKNTLFYYLILEKPYRNLFYYRIGRKCSFFLRIILHPYPLFFINDDMKDVAGGIYVLNHPHSTRIYAKKIGKHLTIRQNTTIGMSKLNQNDLIPTIGDNVEIGANTVIIGDIQIGNNVVIGAGSIVVKNIPDNCVAAGNPARVIKYLNER